MSAISAAITEAAAPFSNGDAYFERDALEVTMVTSLWLLILVLPSCLSRFRCCTQSRLFRNCCCCCMGSANRSFIMSLILWVAWLFVASLALGNYERPAEVKANEQKRELIIKWAEIGDALKATSLTPEQIALINGAAVTEASLTYNWIFKGCAFFVSTLGSTVGYGSYVPITIEGKVISVLLVLPSIVLFLNFSTNAGERLTTLYERTVADSTECCMRLHYGELFHVVGLLKAKEKEGEAWGSSAIVKKLRKMDKNKDGTLSEEEFRHGLERLHMNIPEGEMAGICTDADTDGDGKIDFVEGADSIIGLLSRLEAEADRSRARANIIQIIGLLLILFVVDALNEEYSEDLRGTPFYWPFWTAMYFNFITATTVGLGDVAPIVPPMPLATASESEMTVYLRLESRLNMAIYFKIPVYICLMSAVLQSVAVLWNAEPEEDEEEDAADGPVKKDVLQLNHVKPYGSDDSSDSLFESLDDDSSDSDSD